MSFPRPRWFALLLLLIPPGTARANTAVRPELKPPAPFPPFVLEVTADKEVPTLVVPRDVFQKFDFAGRDRPNRDGFAARWRLDEMPRGQLVAVGLSLGMAVTLSGLWLARSRAVMRRRNLLVVLGVGAAVACTTAVLWANTPAPPPRPRVPVPPALDAVLSLKDVRVVVAQDGTNVRLLIPAPMLTEMKGKLPAETKEKPKP